MGLKKLAGRIDDYNARLRDGKANRIEPDHVEKALGKLRNKAAELEAAYDVAATPEDRERFARKLEIARTHIARAEWLLNELR